MKGPSQILVSLLILEALQKPNLSFPQVCNQKIEDLSGGGISGIYYDEEFILTKEKTCAIIKLRKFYSSKEKSGTKDGCIKLWQFQSSDFTYIKNVLDYPIAVFSDLKQKWCQLSFTVYSSDILRKSVQLTSNNLLYYTEYYAIAYSIEDKIQKEMTNFIKIDLIINRENSQIISIDLKNLNSQQKCQIEPVDYPLPASDYIASMAVSRVTWGRDSSCLNNVPSVLNLNDTFYLRQSVTQSFLKQYYLIQTFVYYVGNGLNKLASPISIDNSIPGQVTVLIRADILWNNVAFQMISYLSTTSSGARRLMKAETATDDPISAGSASVECIKLPSSSVCPTCAEQCEVNNGIAGEPCECQNSFNSSFIFLSILLFIQI